MICVLLKGKRSLSTESLQAALAVQPRVKQVIFAETDEELLGALDQADILLLMTAPSELDQLNTTLAKVRPRASIARIIVLMEARDPALVVAAFKSGARGVFSLKESRLNELQKCIERVHEGQVWANSEELSWIMEALEHHVGPARPLAVVSAVGAQLLSKREEDVVKLVLDGMQNRDIAQTLGLSEHTIKNYLFRIYEKLGISTRTELMLYVLTPRKTSRSLSDEALCERRATGTWGTA